LVTHAVAVCGAGGVTVDVTVGGAVGALGGAVDGIVDGTLDGSIVADSSSAAGNSMVAAICLPFSVICVYWLNRPVMPQRVFPVVDFYSDSCWRCLRR